MKKLTAVGLGAFSIALAFAAKDPIIMTVNGVDVPKSEFEYLYNKNSQQQINPQTLDEYVEMFKLYKMKVADARAEGIDTVSSFLKEAEQYRHDLAEPYLTDSVFLNKLVNEAYERSKEEVEAYHIMLFKTRDIKKNIELRQRADSILQVLNNGGDFADLAARFSQDRSSSANGGSMGWIVSNNFPFAFESEAYSLPEGQYSKSVVESPVGYHILKGGKHRPARGKVKVAHIMRFTKGKPESVQAEAKQVIDSLYNIVIANPGAFGPTAIANSEDPGSARQSGVLPPFGAGEMVSEFDSVAFSLKNGEISKPFKTSYGYHIIHRLGDEPVPSLAELKPLILSKITNAQDPRSKMVRNHQSEMLQKRHKGALNAKNIDAIRKQVLENGLDSVIFVAWKTVPMASKEIFTVDGKSMTLWDLAVKSEHYNIPASSIAVDMLNDIIDKEYNLSLLNAEESRLLNSEPDYANLLREYVDGSLLYEVSVRKVWDKAAKDTEGLNKFFNENRSNYKWSEPHVKGFLVQAANDSVANEIRERSAQLSPDSLLNTLKTEFKGKAMIDRVLLTKGSNPLVDNLMFGASEVVPLNSKYPVYFMINPRLITEPEEVADVKGLVTSDYQNEYQTAWENELRRRYPVTVNEKVLKSVKSISK